MPEGSVRAALKLDIGAGDFRRDADYKTVDVHGEPDVRADMWELPFGDGEVDEIYSSHALEHVPMAKVPETLKEWLRVLRKDGRLELLVPNFDYIAKYWLTGSDRGWAEAMVFGMQKTEGDFHRCAFTPALLRGDLEGVGFVVKRIEVCWTHNQESIKAVCRKP